MHPFLLNTVSAQIGGNFEVFVYSWVPPYGHWNQGETFGSQNGLTFMYPMVSSNTGVWGPSKASLAANIFPTSFSQQIVDNSWRGVGNDKWTLPYDMDWNVSPLNSPTAWIGFTYGNTGHMGYTSVTEKVSAYSWIPITHRVWDYGRHYRAISLDTGITNGEQIYNLLNSRWNPIRTPWIKRKMNFIRQELRNIMRVMGNSGFYMTQSSGDDEFYIYGDYRSIGSSVTGSTTFYNFYMYPFNSSTGFTWYASFTGICAAPDYLISQGITSFRSYLLSHGFTTNVNSSKNVDGLTIMGSLNIANNVGANGSGFQTLISEYSAAVADWVASHWQDYVNDFKELNGLTSDNTIHSNYGYYRSDVGMCGYTSDRNLGQFTGLLKQLSSDISPYPDQTPTSSSINVNKFAYYNYNTLNSGQQGGYVQREAVGGFDAIYVYGAITNYIFERNNSFVQLLDRSKLFGGNSYGYGNSYAVNFNYNWLFPQRMGQSTNTAPIWFVPNNYLNSGLPGQTFIAPSCFEIIGATASRRYDPTGAFGSRTAGFTRCAGNSAPMFISWFLNPVWGITSIGTGDSYGPANMLPLAGRDTLYGLTMGEKSLSYLNATRINNPGATWTVQYFDNCGFPLPGNTIPAGSIYNQYWTHWYPMAFMALLYDVNWGRHIALGNVYRALAQNLGQYPTVPGSNWNGIQKPISTWISDQKLYGGFDEKVNVNLNESGALEYQYYVPTGITFGYFLDNSPNAFTTGITGFVGEAGPLYYENIRHQYLNKTIRYEYWNPYAYSCVVSATGGQVPVRNRGIPQLVNGITCFGICGAITMNLARKINNVVAECNEVGGGLVSQTVYLAPGNMAERSYLMSGAAKAGGGFIWRITFANPVTYPNVVVRGSLSGVTTEYRVAGITDYINIPNNKFGIWWETDLLETPIVENPPLPEATRRSQLNLPEVPKFEYDATQMVASRNPINKYFINNNPQLFCVHDNSTCGYFNQAQAWGSQHGLSYMWPMVAWTTPGQTGPSRSLLAGGTFPIANGGVFPQEISWPGVGTEPTADINMNSSPWNTSTGYIGFTFGSPGFIPQSVVSRIISDYSWIPNQYRVLYPSRVWRAVDGLANGFGITGPESLVGTIFSDGRTANVRFQTPWIKRKINFMRAELTAFYKRAASLGFTMAHWECDDEYYFVGGWDFRTVGATGNITPGVAGDPGFQNNFVAPSYSVTGSTWYANVNGISATPDCLVSAGITSFRSFMLTRGYTTTFGNYRFIDGLTAIGNLGVSGNIAVGGSPWQYPQQEYISALRDWVACMWQDAFNDFALFNGLCADNSMSGNYGYYRGTAISYNYQQPSWSVASNDPFIPPLTQKSSTDLVPFFANPKGDIDKNVRDYYSFNDGIDSRLDSMFTCPSLYVGHVDNIHPYGDVPWFQVSNDYNLIDRSLDIRGNTYRYANSGKTFGKSFVGMYTGQWAWADRYGSNSVMWNSVDAKKWFPPGVFNTPTSGATGSLVLCSACAEEMGNCGFFKYDPTGVCGSSAANPAKIRDNKAPFAWSWHLNPVWGINPTTFNGGATIGPANHLPVYGNQILNGLTQAAITHSKNRSNTGALSYFGSLDACGNPLPGNTLPAGTIYNHYWTNWYPMAFIALLGNVRWGRHVAAANVSTAIGQRNNPLTATRIPGSNWFGVQKPINTWTAHQRWGLHEPISYIKSDGAVQSSSAYVLQSGYCVPEGITFNYYAGAISGFFKAQGCTFIYGEAGPMYYENLRHQYLNKTGRFSYWNPNNYSNTNSVSNTPVYNLNGQFPRYFRASDVQSPTIAAGLTLFGICGADVFQLARKVNTVIGECNTLGKGIVYETTELSSVNMDERSYLASGAQLIDGNYLWRISFAHPATQSPIIVRGAVTGITTAYNINGVTDYINIPNSKFGIWWTSQYNEMPIVENPPVSEAERLGVLNLPGLNAFVYNPLTMTEAEEYRPPINAFAWTWPFDSGTGPAVINNWLTEANRFSNVSPFAVINQSAINDDWKDGLL